MSASQTLLKFTLWDGCFHGGRAGLTFLDRFQENSVVLGHHTVDAGGLHFLLWRIYLLCRNLSTGVQLFQSNVKGLPYF